MVRLSQNDRAIIKAYELGYSYDSEGNIYNPEGEKLNPTLTNYKRFKVAGIKGKPLVHRFIAYGIYGDKIFGKLVRHLDDNPSNNKPENLAVGTPRDNYYDMREEAKKRKAIGTSRNLRKYQEEDVKFIRELLEQGKTHREIRALTGASLGTISDIRNNKKKYY